ncbi:MAG: serine/threonine protein kinase, partial [Chloroflexi bacterium]
MQRSLNYLVEGLTLIVVLALVTLVSHWVITAAPEIVQTLATATATATAPPTETPAPTLAPTHTPVHTPTSAPTSVPTP